MDPIEHSAFRKLVIAVGSGLARQITGIPSVEEFRRLLITDEPAELIERRARVALGMLRTVGVTLGPDERRDWFCARNTAFAEAAPREALAAATTDDDFRELLRVASVFGGEDEGKWWREMRRELDEDKRKRATNDPTETAPHDGLDPVRSERRLRRVIIEPDSSHADTVRARRGGRYP